MPDSIVDVTLRLSFDADSSSTLGTKVKKELNWSRTGTGAFEVSGPLSEVKARLCTALDLVVQHGGPGKLDHLWVYIDRHEPDSL